MRAVTGTLAPTLAAELTLGEGQLGLLAGSYFLGFAAMQLPLGAWLDRHGPRRVLVGLLSVAAVSCVAFALAGTFWSLLVARLLGGIGVSACLMAPLAGYRSWLAPHLQIRASSWMLMSGSVGLVAATLPVQWALPVIGWRPLFGILAALFAVTIAGTAWQLPAWTAAGAAPPVAARTGYGTILRSRYFRSIAPLALIPYGSVIAVQTLWATQWMTHVAGYSPQEAANGLFAINLTMLVIHWLWGTITPRLASAGLTADRLMRWGVPLGVSALAAVALAGDRAGWGALAACLALASSLSMAHPAVVMAFPPQQAGRAATAFNLLLFLGAFGWQWLIGVFVDRLRARQWSDIASYRAAFGALAVAWALAYVWFAVGGLRRDRAPPRT
ncbi:MAG: MFS transporter [Deltaproteobacteria bacterium]|nr:MAG: MFS transporter [Deltaproteobacteria bacterium]TMQ19554.1 MAG: MFS transporter [Deltaproteobacteria bacterium]